MLLKLKLLQVYVFQIFNQQLSTDTDTVKVVQFINTNNDMTRLFQSDSH